jgi:hypothetical protein
VKEERDAQELRCGGRGRAIPFIGGKEEYAKNK